MFQGCHGILGKRTTLSSTGGPCYFDLTRTDCAICKHERNRQCGPNKWADRCGNFCAPAGKIRTFVKKVFIIFKILIKGLKACDGNFYGCDQIPKCGEGATCKKGVCKCDDGN